MTEDKGSFWTTTFLKLLAVAIITIIPITAVSWFLDVVGIVQPEWRGSTVLTCGLIFFVGSLVLVYSEDYRWNSLYVFAFGGFITIGCVFLSLISLLAYIPLPIVGNLFNLTFYLAPVILILVLYMWPDGEKKPSAGLISTSIKTPTPLSFSLFRSSPTIFKAMELIEIPHEYAFKEDDERDGPDYRPFISFVRHLANSVIPFSLRIERNQNRTRLLLLTWSNEEDLLNNQLSGLKDALHANLPRFRFESIGTYSGLPLNEHDRAAYATVTGIPLSLQAEDQTKNPLNGLAEVLSYMNHGVLQVTIEPKAVTSSTVKSLEANYRREIEASETTISREKKGLFSGPRQESQVIVDPRAKRNAEILKRKIERYSNPILCDTTVTVLSWDKNIEDADQKARRLANTLVGSLRPDSAENEFTVRYKTKQGDASKIMRGQHTGDKSTLTPEEAACYFALPTTDFGIKTARRGKFSSGGNDETKILKQDGKPPGFESCVPTKVKLSPRRRMLQFGHPVDANGRPQENLVVYTTPHELDCHLGVFGNTRSGKTTSTVSLIAQSITSGLKPVILVPSKSSDWRILLDIFPDIRVFTCGRNNISPLVFNFWNPPDGTPLSKWVDRVIQFLTLWLPNDRILSMHVEDLVFTVYNSCGWDIAANRKGRPILLQDLVDAVETVIEDLAYGDEVHANFRGALTSRVKSLLRRPSLVRMFNTTKGITIPELLAHPTIIEMDNLSGMDKVLLMGILTAAISEYKLATPSQTVEHLLVLEEAHYILGRKSLEGEANSGARAQAVSAFIEMLRVLGGTGLGVILIDQLPTSLVTEAVKLPVNTVIHALVDEDDRHLVGKHARCTDEQIEHIAGMKTGEAVIYLQDEGEPKNVRVFSVDCIIAGAFKKRAITDEMVANHMRPLWESNPEFYESKTLPDGIVDWVNHRSIPVVGTSPNGLGAEIQHNLEKAVASDYFQQFCQERLSRAEDKDFQILAKVICLMAEEFGDGSKHSVNHILSSVLRDIHQKEEDALFERLVLAVQGALEA